MVRWQAWIVAAVRDGQWYWGLGDPDAGSILVTLLYFVAVGTCLAAARASAAGRKTPGRSMESKYWLADAFLFSALGFNKQADLQSLLTLWGRNAAHYLGLYDVRRMLQVVFIAIVASAALLGVLICLRAVRAMNWQCKLAVMGLGLQAAFVVVRASSFHHVDVLLGLSLGEMRWNLLLESTGICLTLIAAGSRLAFATGGADGRG